MTDEASAGHQPGSEPGPNARGGNRRAVLLTVLVYALVVVVAVLQQTAGSVATRPGPGPAPDAVSPPRPQFELVASIGTRMSLATNDRQLCSMVVSSLDGEARAPTDQLRLAMVAGELLGEPESLKRLNVVGAQPGLPADLVRDMETVRAIYAGTPEPQRVRELIGRHHWFGRLAATHGLSDTDPVRRSAAGSGWTIVGGLMVAIGVFGVAVVLLIIAVVRAAIGAMPRRYQSAARGESVGAETALVFIAGFIILKVATELIGRIWGAETAVTFTLAAQWSLIATLFWPVVRGVRAREALRLWGIQRAGVLREVGYGVLAYLTVLPLFVGGAVVSAVLLQAYEKVRTSMGGAEHGLPRNPVIDLFSGTGHVWMIVALGLLASLWAPLVEESIFRGALYRQLRTWWHWLPAGLATALAFGFMHGYAILLLGPVIGLGFGFALVREWRGSLIPSMTAHCIHNAVTITAVLLVSQLIGP